MKFSEWMRRFRYWLSGDESGAGLDDEMRLHLELREERLRAEGLTPVDARREARRRFGSALHLRERSRDMWIGHAWDDLTRDVRQTLRALGRRPGFTAAAVLTLGIAIGANTAVFSVVNGILIEPLGYPRSGELISVANKAPGAQGLTTANGDLLLSPSMYFTFAEQNRTLAALGIWSPGTGNVTGHAQPEQVRVTWVADGTLAALGVSPLLGRGLTGADYQPASALNIVLTHGYWQRRFGSQRAVVGQKLIFDGKPREIVGVMPQGFRVVDHEADVIAPIRYARGSLKLPGFGLQGVARLKPGVTLETARADLARLIPVWMQSWPTLPGVDPKVYESWRMSPALRPLQEEVVGNTGEVLWPVMATIAAVMLMAAANVAGLLLVRMEARHQELAMRAALGASRGRIGREILLESVLLALMGGALGFAGAAVAVRVLVSSGPALLPRLNEIGVNGRVAWFTLVFAVGAGLLAGLIPAWKQLRGPLALTARGTARTAGTSRSGSRTRDALVVGQVALALVLLISAGLMVRTLAALGDVNLGFRHGATIQTARISIPGSKEQVLRAQSNIVESLQTMPGVEAAAFITELPLDGGGRNWDVICRDGQRLQGGEIPPARTFKSISPGFFHAMGTRILAGRDLTWTDIFDKRPFVLISQNLARELFGGATAAVGQRISACVPQARLWEIAGVVEDVRDKAIDTAATSTVYWPPLVEGLYGPGDSNLFRNVVLTVRTQKAGSEGMARQLSQAVHAVNKDIPLAGSGTMQEIVDRALARRTFAMVMLGMAAGMALLLGLVGIYGVIAYAVSQRRREMGIRLALGARPGALKAQFVRRSMAVVGAGIAVGLAGAVAVTRLLNSLLFGTGPVDPVTYVSVAMLLAGAALVASYLPARRVAAVDPVEALRADG